MADSGELEVRGGVGGVTAQLEGLERAADRLCSTAGELGGHGRTLLAVMGDPQLGRTAPLSPTTFVRVESALTAVSLGPAGLPAAAARVELLGLHTRAVVRSYRAADGAASAALRTTTALTGRAVGLSLGPLVPGAVLGAATVLAVTVRGFGIGPLRRLGGLTLRLLADRGPLTEALIPVIPGVIAGIGNSMPGGGALVSVGLFGDLAGPATMADTAHGLSVLGGVIGTVGGPAWLQESDRVTVQARPAPVSRAPTGVSDLLGRIPVAGPSPVGGEAGPGQAPPVHVERVDGVTGRAWVVSVPGTANWAPVAGATPFDLTGDVRLLAGERTTGMAGVIAAMRETGVRPSEPVLLVGHSQGGLIAAALAADPAVRREFRVTQVLTSGAPIASTPVPDDVQVLSIEHTDDLVPRLDGSANRDRPNWTTVSAPAVTADLPAADRAEPLLAHRAELYERTAERIDHSADPSLRHWRAGLAPFMDRPGTTVTGWDVEISRVERS